MSSSGIRKVARKYDLKESAVHDQSVVNLLLPAVRTDEGNAKKRGLHSGADSLLNQVTAAQQTPSPQKCPQ